MMKKIITSITCCLLLLQVFSQEDTAAKKKPVPAKSYFLASIGYLTNAVYNGRKDSLATPYITPAIGYYDKSGFFIDGSLSYLSRTGSSRIDLFTLEAGYDFDAGNFDGEVAASKSFYNSSSTNVSSEITGSLFFTGSYDLLYITPTMEAGINFGTKNDYMGSFGLEHTFYGFNDKLLVTPKVNGNVSTQNYYGSYYNKRKAGGKKKNAGVVYDVSATVEDASRFKMLDYSFSLPISYTCKKITFSISPAYVIPVNPAVVTVKLVPENGSSTKTRSSEELLSNSFYCSFGLSYKF